MLDSIGNAGAALGMTPQDMEMVAKTILQRTAVSS
jgi:hypothetical protein